jgi:hypothetical protein
VAIFATNQITAWQAKNWEGDNTGSYHNEIETGENCIKAITTFVNLVKQLSSNNCNFANGLFPSKFQMQGLH